jgi:cell division septation protein DedD
VNLRVATVTAGIRGTDLWGKSGGKWRVTLASAGTQSEALALYDQLRTAGYAAEIHPVKSGDKRVYVVRISRLSTKGDAEALAAQLRGQHGVGESKVSG